jgi:hypothetical protein
MGRMKEEFMQMREQMQSQEIYILSDIAQEYGYTEPSPSKNNQTPPLLPLSESEWVDLTRIQCKLMIDEGQRPGQAYMNALFAIRNDIYEGITGDSELDCYYSDNKIINLIRYLNV